MATPNYVKSGLVVDYHAAQATGSAPGTNTVGKNILSPSADTFASGSGWVAYAGATITLTGGNADPTGGVGAYRLKSSGGTNPTKYFTTLGQSTAGATYSMQVYIKTGDTGITFGDNYLHYINIPPNTDWQLYKIEGIVASDSAWINMAFATYALGETGDVDCYVFHPMVELSSTCSSYEAPFAAVWRDISGNRIDAILYNMSFNNASGWTGTNTATDPYTLVLDGTNDYGEANYNSALNFTSECTVECWINPAQLKDACFVARNYSTSFYLRMFASGQVAWWTGNASCSTSSGALAINTWYHLVATKTSAGARAIYINTVLKGSTASGAVLLDDTTSKLQVGKYGGSLYFNGKMPIVRLYNRALTTTEITQNYNAGMIWPITVGIPTTLNLDSLRQVLKTILVTDDSLRGVYAPSTATADLLRKIGVTVTINPDTARSTIWQKAESVTIDTIRQTRVTHGIGADTSRLILHNSATYHDALRHTLLNTSSLNNTIRKLVLNYSWLSDLIRKTTVSNYPNLDTKRPVLLNVSVSGDTLRQATYLDSTNLTCDTFRKGVSTVSIAIDTKRSTLNNLQKQVNTLRHIMRFVSITGDTLRIYFLLVNEILNADTKRSIDVNQSVNIDSKRRIALNDSWIADTVRAPILAISITVDTKRTISDMWSVLLGSDTVRHVVYGNTSFTGDTKRIYRNTVSISCKTTRSTGNTITIRPDTSRVIALPSIVTTINIDSSRTVVYGVSNKPDTIRKIGSTVLLYGDVLRQVKAPFSKVFDTARLINTDLHLTDTQLSFDTSRTIAPKGALVAKTSRHINLTTLSRYDTSRKTKRQFMSFVFDTIRTKGTGFIHKYDLNRRIAMAYVSEVDISRIVVRSITTTPETLRLIIVNFLPKELFLNGTSFDTDYTFEVSATRNHNYTTSVKRTNDFSSKISRSQKIEVKI